MSHTEYVAQLVVQADRREEFGNLVVHYAEDDTQIISLDAAEIYWDDYRAYRPLVFRRAEEALRTAGLAPAGNYIVYEWQPHGNGYRARVVEDPVVYEWQPHGNGYRAHVVEDSRLLAVSAGELRARREAVGYTIEAAVQRLILRGYREEIITAWRGYEAGEHTPTPGEMRELRHAHAGLIRLRWEMENTAFGLVAEAERGEIAAFPIYRENDLIPERSTASYYVRRHGREWWNRTVSLAATFAPSVPCVTPDDLAQGPFEGLAV